MKLTNARKFLLVALLGLILGFARGPNPLAHEDVVLALKPPPFTGATATERMGVTAFPEDEAGISAYSQASTTIDLDDVRGMFRTIETETSNYIIGSVPAPDYPETEDVHVYIHTDGWVLAYYLAEDPVGKIFDWQAYHTGGRTNLSTKLENTLSAVAIAAGVLPFPDVTYYDFRYPNATHLMLIVEWVYQGTDSFQVNLPGTFAYYERSWSLGGNKGGYSYRLNGVSIAAHNCVGWPISQGSLTPVQLPTDQPHWIEAHQYLGCVDPYGYAGLALVYRVP